MKIIFLLVQIKKYKFFNINFLIKIIIIYLLLTNILLLIFAIS